MYTVTVTGSNVGGESPKSPPLTITTKQGVPTSVRNFTVIPNSEVSVNISWIEPIALNGKLTHYEISYSPNGGTLMSNNTHILVAYLNDQEYTFTVRAITGGGTSHLFSVKERPSVSPRVSGNADVSLPYKGSASVKCDFRRYPAPPIPTLKRSGVDLTSSAIITDRTSHPLYTQRLTYTTTQVGTFSCEFDGVEDSFEVTAPAQIINSTTKTGVKYVDSPVTIFVEGRQYPGTPNISCTDSSDTLFDTPLSSFKQPDGANYRRLTFEVSKAITLTCSITGSDVPVTIEITSDDERENLVGVFVGVPFSVLLIVAIVLAVLLCHARNNKRLGTSSDVYQNASVEMKAAPVYEEIPRKGEDILESSQLNEGRVTESAAYASFKTLTSGERTGPADMWQNPAYATVSELKH